MKGILKELKIQESNMGLSLILFYHRLRRLKYSRLSDEEFAKEIYHKAGLGNLDLVNPKTFDEKLWWLKINYRDPLMIDCTDKVKVRKYVEQKGYPEILNEVYQVYDTASEIEWDELPQEFYIKTNNSSATNIYIKDKNQVNKKWIEKRLDLYLKKDHYSLSREWNYRDVVPKIFAEKRLESDVGLIDYRFICNYGSVKGLFIDTETADEKGNHNPKAKRNVYDSEFNLLDVNVTRPRFKESENKLPQNIVEMKEIAEKLSEPFPFCRVDLYNINGDIVFGELTFFHTGGVNKIKPREYELILGEWINLP